MGWRGPEPETRPELLGAGGVGLRRRVGARRSGGSRRGRIAGGMRSWRRAGLGSPGRVLEPGFQASLGLARRTLAERLRRDRLEPGSAAWGGVHGTRN